MELSQVLLICPVPTLKYPVSDVTPGAAISHPAAWSLGRGVESEAVFIERPAKAATGACSWQLPSPKSSLTTLLLPLGPLPSSTLSMMLHGTEQMNTKSSK